MFSKGERWQELWNEFLERYASRSREILALDLGSSRMSWVQLIRGSQGVKIAGFWIDEKPPGADESWIGSKLRERITQQGWQAKGVLLTTALIQTFFRRLLIPEVSPDELKKAIHWQIRELLPFPVESAIVEYWTLGRSASEEGIKRLDLFVAAAEEKQIREIVDSVEQAGLEVAGLTLVPFALWQGLLLDSRLEDQNLVLLDIGFSTTSLSIVSKRQLRFCRQIPTAGAAVTEAMTGSVISDRGRVDLTVAQAEELKRSYGIPERNTTQFDPETNTPLSQMGVMMRPALERLINEIQRTLDYYRIQYQGEKMDQVLLSGGGGLLKGLDAFLKEVLGVSVSYLNIPEKLRPGFPLQTALRLNVACGLAVGHPLRMNFLPGSYRVRRRRKTQASVFRVAGITTAALLILFYLWTFWQVRQAELTLSAAQVEWRNARLITELKGELDERQSFVNAIQKENPSCSRLMKEISLVTPSYLVLENFDFDWSKREFNLEGLIFAKEGETEKKLSTYIQQLKQCSYVINVRLIKTEQQKISNQNAARFKILCDLSQ